MTPALGWINTSGSRAAASASDLSPKIVASASPEVMLCDKPASGGSASANIAFRFACSCATTCETLAGDWSCRPVWPPLRSVRMLAADPVEHGLHLDVVVRLLCRDAVVVDPHFPGRQRVRAVALRQRAREIDTLHRSAVRDRRVDLRRVEFVDALAGRSVHEIVRRVFVGPCTPPTSCLDHFENGIYLHERVGKDGSAAARI